MIKLPFRIRIGPCAPSSLLIRRGPLGLIAILFSGVCWRFLDSKMFNLKKTTMFFTIKNVE